MLHRPAQLVPALLLLALGCSPSTPAPAALEIPSAPPAPPSTSAAQASSSRAPTDGFFSPELDVITNDASLPAGTVQVTVVDADGAPIPRAPITLESVLVPEVADRLDVLAKETATADDRGVAVFRKLRTDAGVHQVVSTTRCGGVFQAVPFVLDRNGGKRVRLHAYETVTALEQVRIATHVVVALTVRADTIDIKQFYTVLNVSRTAWVPSSVRVGFPPNVADFAARDLGTLLRTDEITATGFNLVGIVPPGTHELTFSYQIPRDPAGTQPIHLELPPRSAVVRVMLEARGTPTLGVAGFPEATAKVHEGATLLMTEKVGEPSEGGLHAVDIVLAGDPR